MTSFQAYNPSVTGARCKREIKERSRINEENTEIVKYNSYII
jgi:hypothetical protein